MVSRFLVLLSNILHDQCQFSDRMFAAIIKRPLEKVRHVPRAHVALLILIHSPGSKLWRENQSYLSLLHSKGLLPIDPFKEQN